MDFFKKSCPSPQCNSQGFGILRKHETVSFQIYIGRRQSGKFS